jgi:hypothetical protein
MQIIPTLVMIVPRLPPNVDGVGDYSFHLAQQFRKQGLFETCFIVCDPKCVGQSEIDSFPVTVLMKRSPEALQLALKKQGTMKLMVQFSGYGFSAWGDPHWLIQGLQQWKGKNPNSLLVTMFHELHNVLGKPWQHNFWVYLAQKKIVKDLAILSDHVVTNTEGYAATLKKMVPLKNLHSLVLPVFSNVAELKVNPRTSGRKPVLVIFGQADTRRRAYRESAILIQDFCHQFGLTSIIDVGPSTGFDFPGLLDIPVIEQGKLSIESVSQILSTSMAGFINYDVSRLAKSGTFAAYCSHGVVPVTHCSDSNMQDGLRSGTHYLAIDSLAEYEDTDNHSVKLESISTHAYDWYQSHRLEAHAQAFKNLLSLSHATSLVS